MTFNIGNQTAGVVNNVAGDQHVSGGQHGTAVATDTARQAVDALRTALAAARLDEHTAVAAQAHTSQIEHAMQAAEPDRQRVAAALGRLTAILRSAGSLVTAGAPLLGPIHTLASWLGAAGDPILRMLPG
jgi:hypothetical protein